MPKPDVIQDAAKQAASKGLPPDTSTSVKQQQSELGPNVLLSEHMNAAGDPVPDPSFDTKAKKPSEDDPDLYTAMNAETADFD
jgi:hypothetical protein